MRNADLDCYTPQCIASVLKKFLQELPDPVIPVQFYDRFLEASSKYSSVLMTYGDIHDDSFLYIQI